MGAEAVEKLKPGAKVIITGQIGCGKTTLAALVAPRLQAVHVRLDQFIGRDDPKSTAVGALDDIAGGWVLDGCVWQVPDEAWKAADLAIHLDYSNAIHHRRIARRAILNLLQARSIQAARTVVADEWGHAAIMRRHAEENRSGWARAGGITSFATPVLRLERPREARTLLQPERTPRT